MIHIVTEQLSRLQLTVRTSGLNRIGQQEICAKILNPELRGETEEFLKHVSDYVLTSGNRIHDDETMPYGYWLVKFVDKNEDVLETWEYKADATEFTNGIDLTLGYWRGQQFMCRIYNSEFQPPRPDRLTVISDGVLEGLPVQAIRYPSPTNMSGWWITTDLYNGDVKTLKNHHCYHVTAKRPDLARFLALAPGFRFELSATERVWFDATVASGTP